MQASFWVLRSELGWGNTRSAISLTLIISLLETTLFRLYHRSEDTFTSLIVKGMGKVGFEPTHSMRTDLQSAATLQLCRLPLIKAYVQPQLLYYLPKGIIISGFRFVTWTLPMFPILTDEACQSPTSILQSPTLAGAWLPHLDIFTNQFYRLKLLLVYWCS